MKKNKFIKVKKSKNHIIYIDDSLSENTKQELRTIMLKSTLSMMTKYKNLVSGYTLNITPRLGNYKVIEVFKKGVDEYTLNWTMTIMYKTTPLIAVKLNDYGFFGLEESKIYILHDDAKAFRILTLILQNRFGLYKQSLAVISFIPTLSVPCYKKPTIIQFTEITDRAIGVKIKPINIKQVKDYDYILSVKDAVHQQILKEWFMSEQY